MATTTRATRRGSSTRRAGSSGQQTLIIFGATGDLTARLLLPGVGKLLADEPKRNLLIIGVGRDAWSEQQWTDRVTEAFASAGATGRSLRKVIADSFYVRADVTNADDLRAVLGRASGPISLFFALPPAVTMRACRALTEVGLSRQTKLALEKPFGTNSTEAMELNELLLQLVPENHIFRIDHFLGKSTVLNLLGLRFGNRMYEPLFSSEHVARIEIVFDEDLGLEGRAGYYDTAGALMDMIQSHLLQVLALTTMEPPPTLGAADLRDRTSEILRATHVWADDPVTYSRRARYTGGTVGNRKLQSYASSPGVDASRKTETLAEVLLEVDTWRWRGVPILLRSGKAIGTVRKELIVTLKPPPRVPTGFRGKAEPEQIRVGFSDPAGVVITTNVNGPGDPFQLDVVDLQAELAPGALPPYGEVLGAVLDGSPSLTVRGDAAVDSWRIVEPVLDAWRADKVPLDSYRAGKSGPSAWRTELGD